MKASVLAYRKTGITDRETEQKLSVQLSRRGVGQRGRTPETTDFSVELANSESKTTEVKASVLIYALNLSIILTAVFIPSTAADIIPPA